jgi:proline dehydrogenase
MLARSILLRASRSDWLAEQFRRRAFARRAVRRFLPGEELSDAMAAGERLSTLGLDPVYTHLGEQITVAAEADAVREHYVSVLEQIRVRGAPAQISVKLTQLGVLQDRDVCIANVSALARKAAECGSFVWIDIEESGYAEVTLAVFRAVRGEHANVGLCLQSYLLRTPRDIDSLLPLRPAIRLVKGAYREPPTVAHERKRDVDDAFFRLACKLLDAAGRKGALPVFGTHDLELLDRIRQYAVTLGLPREAYEVHMLYGIRVAEQRRLADEGVRVRVLISYGRHWFPWYMRRLAERPANIWFVVKSVVGRSAPVRPVD